MHKAPGQKGAASMSFWEEDQQEQQSFFGGGAREQATPLANRLRPQELSEFSGQTHLLGEGKVLRQLIDQDQISSMIFWGCHDRAGDCSL